MYFPIASCSGGRQQGLEIDAGVLLRVQHSSDLHRESLEQC